MVTPCDPSRRPTTDRRNVARWADHDRSRGSDPVTTRDPCSRRVRPERGVRRVRVEQPPGSLATSVSQAAPSRNLLSVARTPPQTEPSCSWLIGSVIDGLG